MSYYGSAYFVGGTSSVAYRRHLPLEGKALMRIEINVGKSNSCRRQTRQLPPQKANKYAQNTTEKNKRRQKTTP